MYTVAHAMCTQRRGRRGFLAPAGFTLLEVLLSVALLAMIASITLMVFSAATAAWQRGTMLVERLHHGDYVMNQLVVALRSAYWKPGGQGQYGFWHTRSGSDASSADEMSWVKIGGALIGRNQNFAETPHRVRFFLTDDNQGAAFTAWRLAGQPEDFDADTLAPVVLSNLVRGFRCRMAYMLDVNNEIEWLDEWEKTNAVPILIELTLYLDPVTERDAPIEMRRVVPVFTAQEAYSEGH